LPSEYIINYYKANWKHWNLNGNFSQFPFLATISTDNPSTDVFAYVMAMDRYCKPQLHWICAPWIWEVIKRELVAKTTNFLSTAFDISKKPAYSIKHELSRA